MFTSTFFVVWTVLLAYVLLLIIVNMLMQRAEKLYQKNQLAMQQQYTETLEAKNRQLEETLDQAEKDKGSTFVITIPFEIAPAPSQTTETAPDTEADIHGLRLMVVEDNELNAEIT